MHNHIPGSPAYHRDMKSANVALMADYTPKIIDCGLSKYVPDAGAGGMSIHSTTGNRFGTPGYMCPEYSKKVKMLYDAKCEVFSFGVVMLELLTGKLQNYLDANGKEITLEDVVEEEVLLGLVPNDDRIEWSEGFKEEFMQLARKCTAVYKNRVSCMKLVMRCLVVIRAKYHIPFPSEASLLAKNQALIAHIQALQLQNDVRDTS
jgi:serine/threonine protein kinase